MIDTAFLQELDHFSFMVRKRVSTIYAGQRRSLRQGRGIDVVDFREYYPGDDIKSIDWKLYSRTERLYVRRYEEEKNLTTHILVDASRSMDFGKPRKFDYAAMIAAGFAYLVTKENERFALATYSDGLKSMLSPRRGRSHFLNAIAVLNGEQLEGRTNFAACAERYSKLIKTRSLAVVVSDFLEPLESIELGIAKLASAYNELILVQVLDAQELSLRGVEGDVKLHDMETRRAMRTYLSPRSKEEYKQRLGEHVHGIRKLSREVDADFYAFTTATQVFQAFVEMMA